MDIDAKVENIGENLGEKVLIPRKIIVFSN